MGELTSVDVVNFTRGLLQAADNEVVQMLDAALTVARRHAGWHVTPVLENQQIVVDGPGSRILWLPTRRLIDVSSVSENGTALTLSTLNWSTGGDRHVAMRKRSGAFWSDQYGAIEMTITHGFTEVEASDWRRAILSMVDQMSLVPVAGVSGASNFGMRSKQVDDVVYRWDSYVSLAEEVVFSVENILSKFSLPTMEFI